MDMLRAAKISAVFAAIIFNNWLLGIFLNHRLLAAGGSVSELSATGQPHAWLFRALDIVAGILFMITAALIFRQSSGGRYWRWIAVGLIILGISNCADAILHLPCAGTVDPACSAPIHVGLRRISLPDHALSSVIIGIMYLFLPLITYRSAAAKERRGLKPISLITLVVTVIFFILLFIESVNESSVTDRLAGFSEELQMIVFGYWLTRLTPAKALPHQAVPLTSGTKTKP